MKKDFEKILHIVAEKNNISHMFSQAESNALFAPWIATTLDHVLCLNNILNADCYDLPDDDYAFLITACAGGFSYEKDDIQKLKRIAYGVLHQLSIDELISIIKYTPHISTRKFVSNLPQDITKAKKILIKKICDVMNADIRQRCYFVLDLQNLNFV